MTPELIARVDAWLDSRGDWSAATDDRSCLACDWADQSKRPLDPGVRAMLSGILLALVREAWGNSVDVQAWLWSDGEVEVEVYRCKQGETVLSLVGVQIGEVLVAALEAAP